MASDKTIHIRIDVTKVNKKWFFQGKKGTYLDMTLFYNEEQDEYGNNGMVVQSVPSDIYKKEKAAGIEKSKMSKGEILGNAKDWATSTDNEARKEASPGYAGEDKPTGKQANKKAAAPVDDNEEPEEVEDDLPF